MFLEDFVSLDLSAGQFPDLEIQNPHPTPKETDKKEYRVCFSGWIGIWNNIGIGEFYSEFCNWNLNKVGFGEFHSEFMIFFLVEIGIWMKFPFLKRASNSAGCSSQEWDLEGANSEKKKRRFPETFWCVLFCVQMLRSCWIHWRPTFIASFCIFVKCQLHAKPVSQSPHYHVKKNKQIKKKPMIHHDWFGSLTVADKCCPTVAQLLPLFHVLLFSSRPFSTTPVPFFSPLGGGETDAKSRRSRDLSLAQRGVWLETNVFGGFWLNILPGNSLWPFWDA